MAPQVTPMKDLKVQLKLSVSRLRMVQQKDTALAKQQRRAMAQLVEQGKISSARIRVENVIRSDIMTELYEILENYCELLTVRFQLLDPPKLGATSPPSNTCDPGLEEAVKSIIYAAPRTEVLELHKVRSRLAEKFGKDFTQSAVEGEGVATSVLKKLKIEAPSAELVDLYLKEICRTYQVPWPFDEPAEDEDEDEDMSDGEGGGQRAQQEHQTTLEEALQTDAAKSKADGADKNDESVDELKRAKAPKALGGAGSPLRVTPPSPSTENVTPRIRLPGQTGKETLPAKKKSVAPKKKDDDGPGGKIPNVDDLAKRFAALKR